jgi:hypothetical protein
MTIWHPPTKAAEYGLLQGFYRLPGTASVREDVSNDVPVTGIYHHKQIGVGATGPYVGKVSFPVCIIG